jgi:hypothetical protein
MPDDQINQKIKNLRIAAAEANELEDWESLTELGAAIARLEAERLGSAGAHAHKENLQAENERAARRWEQVAEDARRAAGLTLEDVTEPPPPADDPDDSEEPETEIVEGVDRDGNKVHAVVQFVKKVHAPPAAVSCDQIVRVRIRAVRPRTRRRGAGAPSRRKTASASSSGSSDGPGEPPPAPGKAAGELADALIAAVLDELREGNAAELTATIKTKVGNGDLSLALVIATLALGDAGVRFDWAPVEPEPGEAHRLFVFAEPKR